MIQSVYRVPPTEREATKEFTFDNGVTITVNASSIFYGTESAVDRDTDHWGNIMRYDLIARKDLDGPYVVGEFTGDRFGEVVSYAEGVLLSGSSVGRRRNAVLQDYYLMFFV